jgi:hypothetical protein
MRGLWHPGQGQEGSVADTSREELDKVLGAYGRLQDRFDKAGGLREVLSLYEGLKTELAKVSEAEIEGLTAEIKELVESLLEIDYQLRKVQNLKLLFDEPAAAGNGAAKED